MHDEKDGSSLQRTLKVGCLTQHPKEQPGTIKFETCKCSSMSAERADTLHTHHEKIAKELRFLYASEESDLSSLLLLQYGHQCFLSCLSRAGIEPGGIPQCTWPLGRVLLATLQIPTSPFYFYFGVVDTYSPFEPISSFKFHFHLPECVLLDALLLASVSPGHAAAAAAAAAACVCACQWTCLITEKGRIHYLHCFNSSSKAPGFAERWRSHGMERQLLPVSVVDQQSRQYGEPHAEYAAFCRNWNV
eukprot:1154234-Pelagomonas_calceolata.AAC.7